jgi:hypothetical protein
MKVGQVLQQAELLTVCVCVCVCLKGKGRGNKQNGKLYVFFWVFPRRQIVICRRFGTLCQFHLQRLGVALHPAGEIPKRTHTIFKTRRKFEIKKTENCTSE